MTSRTRLAPRLTRPGPTPRLPPRLTIGLALAPWLALAACAMPQHAPTSRAADSTDRAALAACRTEVDRVYAAQNRVDLSTRDERDTPFAGNYLPGVTSAGLGARYRRDTMLTSCLDNATGNAAPAATPGTTGANPGPTFNPSTPAGGPVQP